MANPGRDEGLRVLEDFLCEATPGPQAEHPGRLGRGVNPGMRIVVESTPQANPSGTTAERVAELRGLSTPQLLTLVKRSGQKLDGQELLAIHDIASERLGEDGPPISGVAIELSREAMRVAVDKGR